MEAILGSNPDKPQTRHVLKSERSRPTKFTSSICAKCNNHTTQIHDYAYDQFSDRIRELMKNGEEPFAIVHEAPWNDPYNPKTSNSIRYFVKFMGCMAIDSKMPVPETWSRFILGKNNSINFSPTIFTRTDIKSEISEWRLSQNGSQWVGHSGLFMGFDSTGIEPISYVSGIEINWAWIKLTYQFSTAEQRDLKRLFPEEVETARKRLLHVTDGS